MEYKQTWREKATPLGIAYSAHTASAHRTSDKDSTGWPTPRANDGTGAQECQNREGGQSLKQAAGWATPTAQKITPQSRDNQCLARDVILLTGTDHQREELKKYTPPQMNLKSGWATPTVRDHKDGSSAGTVPTNGLLGRQVWMLPVQTESPGALNPAHSRWLMGFPVGWDSCGATAMQSSRKSRRNSSKHLLKEGE